VRTHAIIAQLAFTAEPVAATEVSVPAIVTMATVAIAEAQTVMLAASSPIPLPIDSGQEQLSQIHPSASTWKIDEKP
jgi:hypothetical protein